MSHHVHNVASLNSRRLPGLRSERVAPRVAHAAQRAEQRAEQRSRAASTECGLEQRALPRRQRQPHGAGLDVDEGLTPSDASMSEFKKNGLKLALVISI